MRIPTVTLLPGTFSVSSVSATDFRGTLQGTTRASTVVRAIDDSIDCELDANMGQLPAMFRFVGGTVRVRYMTLLAMRPCGTDDLYAMLHFTGRTSTAQCGTDFSFSEVDRVDMVGPGVVGGSAIGVVAAPQGTIYGGCNVVMSGTHKLNRSTLRAMDVASLTSMRANSPVEIRFNEFSDNLASVYQVNAYQDTSISANEFTLANIGNNFTTGVLHNTQDDGAPGQDGMRLNGNKFVINGDGIAFRALPEATPPDLALVVTDNDIQFQPAGSVGYFIYSEGVSGGLVSGNRVQGDATAAVRLLESDLSGATSGWSITDNDFNGATIFLEGDTSGNIVGPDQNAVVVDIGSGNFDLQ